MTLSPKAASEELGPSRPSSMTARTSWKRPLRKGLPAIPLKQNGKTTCGSRTMAKQKAHGPPLQMLWKLSWPRKLKKTKERAQPLEGPRKPLEEGSP